MSEHKLTYRVDRFWFYYFLVRLFYLAFTVFVYSRLTTLGDTERYMTAATVLSPDVFFNSTAMMDFIGSILGRAGGSNFLTNLPAMLVSFFTIRWAIDKLKFREHINPYLLFVLLSLPNFCIWTSVVSKETVGLVFSSILGVLIVEFLKGNYKLHLRDWGAFYLCGVFKPQYLPFIVQGLLYIYVAQRWCRTAARQLVLGLVMLAANVGVLWALSDTVNEYAQVMPAHFFSYGADSNRNEGIWEAPGAVFTEAPMGMFVSFVGPTPREMLSKPMHFIAGVEGYFIVFLFLWLIFRFAVRNFVQGKFSPLYFFSYFIIITGIAFVHYPFGIFNPGSAIRYRTNFLMLFIIILLYLYQYYASLYGRSAQKS
jgi:hypothetical protein